MSRLHDDQRLNLHLVLHLHLQMIRRWSMRVVPAALVLVLAVACADDGGDRQFASDPPTPNPTEPVDDATPATQTAAPPARPPASPETLVRRRGAPAVVYAYIDGALRSLNEQGQQVVFEGPVAGFDSSPSGDRVAVATAGSQTDGTSYSVQILDPDGAVDQRFEKVLIVPSTSATPVATDASPQALSVSWAPQGRRILLAHPSGQLVDLQVDGETSSIEARSSLEGTVQAAWSPRGDSLGVLMRRSDGRGELAIVNLSEDPATVNVIAPVGDGTDQPRSVEHFAWKPNGSGVYFLDARMSGAGISGGSIISWDQATNETRIVATGGQAGPTGSVSAFRISPDGKALVYRIDLPTGEGWSFSGLYVRSIRTGQVYEVPVAGNASVIDAWWLQDGLVWAETTAVEGPAPITINQVSADGAVREITSIVPETDATPVASPAGASPAATPESATPAATPIAMMSAT